MSTVLVQRVIEVYEHMSEEPIVAFLAEYAVKHEQLLPNTNRIVVGNVEGTVQDSSAVFNQANKQFSYIYTLNPDMVCSEEADFNMDRFRFMLTNRFDGWTITLLPNYDSFLDATYDLWGEFTLVWDGTGITTFERDE